MYIIFVKNYKFKLIILSGTLIFLLTSILLVNFFIKNSLIYKVTINNYLTFSYPVSFDVENIYVNENINDDSIETNIPFIGARPEKFQNYQSLKGKFSFSYPSVFTLSQKDFAGSEILYHIDYKAKLKGVHGFVQVWNMPYSLEGFLESSKSTSTQTYKYFNTSKVKVSGSDGYFWDYVVLGGDNIYYKANEVFFKKNDRMYRISYFVPESKWDKSQSDIFWGIVNSFKVHR